MERATLTPAQVLAALAPWIADPLTGAQMRLYVNDITPTPASVIGDFTIATFTGYAAVVVAPQGDPDLVGSAIEIPLNLAFFQTTDDVDPPQLAYGYIIADGTTLLAYNRFATPVTFATTNDYASFAPVIRLPLS